MKSEQTTREEKTDAQAQEAPLPLMNALRDEASTLAETLLAIVPALAYGCVFLVRLRMYQWLGLPRQLVSVRVEDVLFVGILALILYWSRLADWLLALLNPQARGKRVLGIVDLTLLAILVIQACMVARISITYRVFDVYQYAMLGLQAACLVLWVLVRCRRGLFGHDSQKLVGPTLFVCALLFVILSVGRATYLAFHNVEYQYCPEDNALIITYDGDGRAIEKEIVSMDADNTCKLAPGFVINDVEGKQLQVVHFGYVEAETS